MSEILKNLSSISWWFGVIFVGILVSLIASYLKPSLDIWLSNYSKSRENKNEKNRKAWDKEVLNLRNNYNYRQLHLSKISHARGRSVFFISIGCSLPLLYALISVITQYVLIKSPRNEDLTSILYNAAAETHNFFLVLTLASIMIGLLSIILGILYFKSTEKMQRQLEDSFIETLNIDNKEANESK